MSTSAKLYERFFSDPEWSLVEGVIMEYVSPLKDMSTIDTTQPAEEVKAEIKARLIAYEALTKFLRDAQLVNKPLQVKNIFR